MGDFMKNGGGGLLGSALGFLGNMIGLGVQRKQNNLQFQRELDMYERQKQDRINFWQMENQYNTPAAQMQRFKEAGLNPNLIYGQFNNQTPQVQAPSGDVSNTSGNLQPYLEGLSQNMGGMINSIYDLRIKDAQVSQLRASAENLDSQAKLNTATKYLRDLEAQAKATSNKYQREQIHAQIAKLRSEISNNILTGLKISQDTRTSRASELSTYQAINKSKQDMIINFQQHRMSLKEASMRMLKMSSEIDLNKANLSLTNAHTKNTEYQTKEKIVDIVTKKFDLFLKNNNISPNSSGVSRAIDYFFSWLTNDNEQANLREVDSIIETMMNEVKPNSNSLGRKGGFPQY